MNLSSKDTEEVPPSHVDLDAIRSILEGRTPLHEVRVYEALTRDNDLQGLRAIERASGLCRKSVLRVIPPEATARTTLLYRSAKGQFAWDPEDRELMRIEPRGYTSSVHQPILSNSSVLQKVWESLKTSGESQEDQRSVGAQMTRIEQALDPSLDVWANTGEAGSLGDAGWALAMVTRFRPMDFTLSELETICRLGTRQVQRIVKRLEELNWASSVRVGRRILVTVDFSLMVHEDLADDYRKTSRLSRKSFQHKAEAEAVRTMGTSDGRRIRDLWKNRREEVRRIRRLLEGVPENLRYRTDWILKVLTTPDNRSERGWMTRWEGERALRKCLINH